MKKVGKFCVILLAMGLLVGVTGPPDDTLAGDLLKDTNTVLTDQEEILGGDEASCSSDGSDGDPDTLTDNLDFHGNTLGEIIGLDGLPEDLESVLDDLLYRMAPWLWVF